MNKYNRTFVNRSNNILDSVGTEAYSATSSANLSTFTNAGLKQNNNTQRGGWWFSSGFDSKEAKPQRDLIAHLRSLNDTVNQEIQRTMGQVSSELNPKIQKARKDADEYMESILNAIADGSYVPKLELLSDNERKELMQLLIKYVDKTEHAGELLLNFITNNVDLNAWKNDLNKLWNLLDVEGKTKLLLGSFESVARTFNAGTDEIKQKQKQSAEYMLTQLKELMEDKRFQPYLGALNEKRQNILHFLVNYVQKGNLMAMILSFSGNLLIASKNGVLLLSLSTSIISFNAFLSS